MIPVYSYADILTKLSNDFDYWRREGKTLNITMVGLLFARPQIEFAAKEIFPEIEYFNARIGPRLHIFTAGCFYEPPGEKVFSDQRAITPHWSYSDTAFDSLRRSIESVTNWRYEDGVELLLMNATRCKTDRHVSLDFHSAIHVDLQKGRELGCLRVATLMGKLANYCDHYEGDDPTWGFSDRMGARSVTSGIWNLFVSLLPRTLQQDAETARLFIAQDLTKSHPAD
jgi:hypothetical protein